jgi:hypothetical protein
VHDPVPSGSLHSEAVLEVLARAIDRAWLITVGRLFAQFDKTRQEVFVRNYIAYPVHAVLLRIWRRFGVHSPHTVRRSSRGDACERFALS